MSDTDEITDAERLFRIALFDINVPAYEAIRIAAELVEKGYRVEVKEP